MKKIFLYITLMLSNLSIAQVSNCNCHQVLEQLINKIETEYPGFSVKTKDKKSYQSFIDDLTLASKKQTIEKCPQLLKKYTDFFKDPHLWVGKNGVPFSVESTTVISSIKLDIPTFKKSIEFSKDKYEGVWSNETYTLGIKKTSSTEYTAFIIDSKYKEWNPKDVKFKFSTDGNFDYFLLDRTVKTGNYKLIDETILHLEDVSVAFVKQFPSPVLNGDQIKNKLADLDGFYFKKLTEKTSILKLPSFEYHNLSIIDSLIVTNKNLLENSENLIIDLRGNPGGTTDAYQKLLPYIMGKNIRNTGTEFLATQTYINNLEKYKKSLDPNISTKGLDNQIETLKKNIGKFVNFNQSGNSEVYIETVSVVEKSPKNVIVFANNLTGSSAEYFLFLTKQSKKVKIFGKPSYGALDYGNAYFVDLDCSGYQILLPTYRALRLPDYPIDNIGVQPDIYMDKSINDWTNFAIDYLEN